MSRIPLTRLSLSSAIWYANFDRKMHSIIVMELQFAEKFYAERDPQKLTERRTNWSASMLKCKQNKRDLREYAAKGLC